MIRDPSLINEDDVAYVMCADMHARVLHYWHCFDDKLVAFQKFTTVPMETCAILYAKRLYNYVKNDNLTNYYWAVRETL